MQSLRLAPLDWLLAPAPTKARVAWLRGVTYAHRGLHGDAVVENSPGAFARAIAAGLGIECDVQLSSDGMAMVFHDRALDRLTSARGPVADRTAADLKQIALGLSGETIPALADLLHQIAGRAPLLIELKSFGDGAAPPLCSAVAEALAGYQGDHAVMSFDPRVSRWFARHSRQTVRGLVVTESGGRGWRSKIGRQRALWQARPDFLAYDVSDLRSAFANAQRRRGLPLLTWTVRSAFQVERALRRADGYIVEAEGVATAAAKP